MLPPGQNTITIIGWLAQFIPGVGRSARKWLLSRFNGYMHGGNMRFLTSVKPGEYHNAELLYSVSLFTRIRGVFLKQNPWTAYLADHSIAIYRQKLAHIAVERNP
jgi:hypothetical protein